MHLQLEFYVLWPSMSSSRYVPKRNESTHLHKDMDRNVCGGFIIVAKKLDKARISTNSGIDKQMSYIWYIHIMEHYVTITINYCYTQWCWSSNRMGLEQLWGATPRSRAKEKHSRTVGGVKLYLESNPVPARDAQSVQTNLVCTRMQRPLRDWDRTVFGCLLRRYGQQWTAVGAGALGAVDLGMS